MIEAELGSQSLLNEVRFLSDDQELFCGVDGRNPF